MIFSPSRGFCFVHVSKTGGTSIEAAYIPHIRFGDVILAALPEGMDTWYGRHLSVGKHTPARRIRLLAGRAAWERMLSIAVVRDPVERIVSYYRWIHSTPHAGQRERELGEVKDFSAFAEKVCRFLLHQVDMVTDPKTNDVIVKHLIPFRRLSVGWAGVAARLGIEAPLPHVNASSPKIAVEVPEAARAMLREVYARDVALVAHAENVFAPLTAGGQQAA